MKPLVFCLALAASFLLIGAAGQVWAVDWGECQRTEASKLQPDIVIPACSRIIDAGEASQADLAVAHYRRARGYHKEGDLDRAIADYDRAIELNPDLARAYHNRAVAYYNKGGFDRAVADYKKAAEHGVAYAQVNLSNMYRDGLGVAQDYAEAAKWTRKAAEQGVAQAQFNLGVAYANGQGVPQDYGEALNWYRKAAKQGDYKAQYNLGIAYANGEGVPQNHTEAVKWFRKAADQGYAEAQARLGMKHLTGKGTPKDLVAGYTWLLLAAEQGDKGVHEILYIAEGTLMTPDQIAEAERMAREWMEKHPQ